jgi:hypothetical protein
LESNVSDTVESHVRLATVFLLMFLVGCHEFALSPYEILRVQPNGPDHHVNPVQVCVLPLSTGSTGMQFSELRCR